MTKPRCIALKVIPAFSNIFNSSCTHCLYFSGNVYGLCEVGGKSPVTISIVSNFV